MLAQGVRQREGCSKPEMNRLAFFHMFCSPGNTPRRKHKGPRQATKQSFFPSPGSDTAPASSLLLKAARVSQREPYKPLSAGIGTGRSFPAAGSPRSATAATALGASGLGRHASRLGYDNLRQRQGAPATPAYSPRFLTVAHSVSREGCFFLIPPGVISGLTAAASPRRLTEDPEACAGSGRDEVVNHTKGSNVSHACGLNVSDSHIRERKNT